VEGGDRRVGDWDPRGSREDECPGAAFFRGVERRPAGAMRNRKPALTTVHDVTTG